LYSQKFTSWGFNAGYVRSQIIGDHYKGFLKQGFTAGVFSQLQLMEDANLQLGLVLINKGCSGKRGDSYKYTSYFDILYYVEIPILFQYNYKKTFFEGGPGLGLLIWNLDYESSNLKYLSVPPKFAETTFNLGFGYFYSERLSINLRYSNSIIPIRREPTSQYNCVISLSLYYKLILKQ
jgi:hypothetical protein